jgi:hypothetical protein
MSGSKHASRVTRERNIKAGDLPYMIYKVLKEKQFPGIVTREDVVVELLPPPCRRGPAYDDWKRNKQEFRRQVTICLSDPDVVGYAVYGTNSKGPRFYRVKSVEEIGEMFGCA